MGREFLIHQIRQRGASVFLMAAMLVLMSCLVGCGESEDVAQAQACTFHSECPLGFVCSFEDECIQTSCEDCPDSSAGVICLKNDEFPDGVCSLPQCTSDEQCDVLAGESCQNGACVGEGSGGGSCNNDEDCPGTDRCGLDNECVAGGGTEPDPSACDADNPCPDGQICDLNNECVEDPGSSSDECEASEECDDGFYCEPETGQCAAGDCADSTECEGDDMCNEQNLCEAPSEEPCGGCPSGQVCNTQTDQCEDEPAPSACDPACASDEICDESSGTCVENHCPPGSQTPESCANDPVYNLFNAEDCYCAQCLGDADCPGAETCTANGECMNCQESCDPADGGNACAQDGFFCINDCCVECTGNSDCDNPGEVCVDGQCQEPPSCADDPAVCRGGTVCNDQGQCVPPSSGGGECTDEMDCFPFGSCVNGRCEDNDLGPGMPDMFECDPPCPGGEDACIMGMLCGCTSPDLGGFPIPISSDECPDRGMCFFDICL